MSAGRTTAEARGDLAERMLPVAAHMAMLVHGDGGPQDIADVLAGLDATERTALIVVLAGLVDPDRPIGTALGGFDFDHTDTPVIESWNPEDPVSSLAEEFDAEVEADFIDPAAVDAYLAGRDVTITKRERLEAVRVAVESGMMYPDLDGLHNLRPGSTSTFVSRSRMTFHDWGMAFPEFGEPVAPFTERMVLAIRERAADGATDLEQAMSYGVARETITNVASGKTYKAVGGPIRQPRENVPGAATRTMWAHTSAVPPARESAELAAAS